MLGRGVLLFGLMLFASVCQAAEIIAFPLSREGEGGIMIEGELKAGDADVFRMKFEPYSSGVIILNSPGGIAQVGIDIGRAIRMRDFKTWVPSGSSCASACGMIWLGGRTRFVGKSGRVGFHSVYRYENGARVEVGSGNAVFGAYLSQLGLSEKAIRYLASAEPRSMNWLTPELADVLGITMAIYEPESPSIVSRPSPPPADHSVSPAQAPTPSVQVSSLEAKSREFVNAINYLISGPDQKLLPILNGIYADQVDYFGKSLQRDEVVAQINAFVVRWPSRSYSSRPDKLKIICDDQILRCSAEGLVDFDARSFDRNQRSYGVATFEYLLEFKAGLKWPVIVKEGGKVMQRQFEAINQRLSPLPTGRDHSIQ